MCRELPVRRWEERQVSRGYQSGKGRQRAEESSAESEGKFHPPPADPPRIRENALPAHANSLPQRSRRYATRAGSSPESTSEPRTSPDPRAPCKPDFHSG